MIGTITLNPSLDQYLRVPRLVKDEAIRATSVERFAGGKGVNVSRVVHALGGETCAYGFIGGCPGQMLTERLDRAGISHAFHQITDDTRINTTITDLSDHTQTHIRAPGPSATQADINALRDELTQLHPAPAYWVLGGSLPPGAPVDLYERLMTALAVTGAQCVLDTDDEAFVEGLNATPFLIKPNEHEFQRLTGHAADTDAHIIAAARGLAARGIAVIMVSLGPRGAIVVTRDDQFQVTTPEVEVKSKVGAGDATVAGCLVALERGDALRDAVRYGIAAGTAAVLTEGTTLCQRADVDRLLPHISIHTLPASCHTSRIL